MPKINEDFLYFVWQNRTLPLQIYSIDSTEIEILQTGERNLDSGPDFLGAKIRIGDTIWAGNVEMHVKTSDWLLHKHEQNPAYENVILHVVYEHDTNIDKQNPVQFPTLELKSFIQPELIQKYINLSTAKAWIPCEKNLRTAHISNVYPWLDSISVERILNKTAAIRTLLAQTTMSWETAFYIWLTSCYGFKLNNEAFSLLAGSLPLKILQSYSDRQFQVEALLFGQAGLLDQNFTDDYPANLRKEYAFLSLKHQLKPISPGIWKFMRTRPVNFPTVRIAQLATALKNIHVLLAQIFADTDLSVIKKILGAEISDYWKTHYHFDRAFDKKTISSPGNAAIDNLIVNAIVPFIYLYGTFHNNAQTQQKAIAFLEQLPPENNRIIKKWNTLGIQPVNARNSQALIQLFNAYCSKKKCLQCNIGATMLLDING